jgi:hypothetical protein
MEAIKYLYKVCSIFKMAHYVVHEPLFLVCLQDFCPEKGRLTKVILIWGIVSEITFGFLFSNSLWHVLTLKKYLF